MVSLILVTSVPSVRAQSSESTWIITTLDNVGDVGQYCSLEVTPDGSYNIAYLDASNGHLKFATNSTGMANTTVLDDSSQSGYWTSIDKDLNGKLHIAYTTATGEDLYYLNNMNGAWVRQIAKTDYRCFAATSISDDGEGHVYITFHSSIYDDMYYVCNANPPDRWSHHDFYSNANVGEYCSFAMDAAKNTYTSFYDATNRDLLYNFNLVTNNVTIVDSEGDVGQYTSIGIDGGAQPRPFISYYDVTNGNLKMAYKQEPNATSWNRYVIDSFGDVGRFSSIGVEADATVHMAYYDASNQDLKYAVWKDGVSTCMTVDSRGNVGQYASIDIDAEGRPSIAYYDASNGDLKLATLTDQAPTQPGQYVPNAPADLATTLESNNSVRLRWTAPVGNESQPPVSGYRVLASAEGLPDRDMYIGNVTEYLDAGLAYNTTYHYRVRAINSVGEGEASDVASIATLASPVTPQYPPSLAVAPDPSGLLLAAIAVVLIAGAAAFILLRRRR